MTNPFDPDASLALAQTQIRRQANEAVVKGAFYLGLMGLAGGAQTGALIASGRPGYELPCVFALIGAAMSFTILVLARRGWMVGPTKYVACMLFVSMPTGFLLTSHAVMPGGAATYLNGPMPYLYGMLLVMTGFLFDMKLTIACGMVAAGGYLVAAQLAGPQIALLESPDAITQLDLTDPVIYWIKGFIIAFTSLVVGALSAISRRIILSTVKKAYERGSYRLVEPIGQGGMGEVWIAEHNMLARKAAVKLIRGDSFGSRPDGARTLLQRFEREAQATAQLRSPHTIEIFDFGLADDGTFYYVMEFLDGLDLDTLVEQHGPQSAERVVYLLRQACRSLEEAHGQGLVHRDIKPANLFVCRYGVELDFVKVLDFGLVKDRTRAELGAPAAFDPAEHADADPTLTRAVAAVGTPAFMAPESIVSAVDERADIYALGCVGYWLLTGSLLFDARSGGDMLLAHIREQPAPPSSRSEMPIPAALDALVLRCLEKRPDDRPQSVAEIGAALDAIELDAPWSAARRERWWRAHAP